MPTMLIPTSDSNWRTRPPWRVAVDLEGGEPSPPLALTDVRCGRGREGVDATFEWTGHSAEFGDVRRLVERGQRIRALIVCDGGPAEPLFWTLFDGYIVDVRVEFSGDGRRMLIDAIDGIRYRCGGTALCGQHALNPAGQVVFAPDMRMVFNAAGRPNRSQQHASINGRPCFVFQPDPTAADFWSTCDIIDYLLARQIAGDGRIDLPSGDRLNSICSAVDPRGLDVTGMDVLAALDHLAKLACVEFAIEAYQLIPYGGRWRMRWYPAAGGRVAVMFHPRVGQPVSSLTNVLAGSMRIDHDNARRIWVGLGDPERVEATFSLVAGWDPAGESSPHRDYCRSNPRFSTVRDVYRRWVLNEAGDWTPPPYDRGPTADLAALFGTRDCLLVRRKFLPCLSRDAAGKSFGIVVEVSYDGGTSWRNYAGRIEVLTDEAGVWIADESLPPAYWQAATGGLLAVRVTALLESDQRVRAEAIDSPLPNYGRTVTHLVQLPGRFRRQWVDPSSQLAGTAASADVIDDSETLAAVLADRVHRDVTAGSHGQLTLPWLCAAYQVGDRIRGISGQDLSFNTATDSQPREPLVVHMHHRFDPHWNTTLELD